MRPRATLAGFTLMEMMLALMLMALLSAGVYEILGVARKAEARDRDRVLIDQVGKICAAKIARDVQSLMTETSAFNTGLYAEDGAAAGMSGTHSGDWLTFITVANVVKLPDDPDSEESTETGATSPDVVEVQYYIGTDPDGEGQGLIRKVKRRLLDALSDDNDAWETELLAEEVLDMNLRYFDGEEWQESWDSESLEEFPTAIEVTLLVGRVRFEDGAWTSYLPNGAPMERKTFRSVVPLRVSAQGKAGASQPLEGIVR